MNTNQNNGYLAPGEEEFLQKLLEYIRTAKISPRADIAAAARLWEGRIEFRIKMHRQAAASRSLSRTRLGGVKAGVSQIAKAAATSSPSMSQNQSSDAQALA